MSRIYAIGETLLDVIFRNDQPVSATPGGSMLNTAVSLGRLGANISFVSDYGQDHVGKVIDDFLAGNGVDISHVERYPGNKSGIALAFLDDSGDASYQFYKDFPENRMESVRIPFSQEDFLLFGSFFALTDETRPALLRLLKSAKEAGTTIMYDPNFRKPHLHELDRLKPLILENIGFADIVRGSDEDFELIFGVSSASRAWDVLKIRGCSGLIYTANKNGVDIIADELTIHLDVPAIQPVSTIGAGDNFNAGILFSFYRKGLTKADIPNLSSAEWEEAGKRGIAFSTNVCMRYENYVSEEFASAALSDRLLPPPLKL